MLSNDKDLKLEHMVSKELSQKNHIPKYAHIAHIECQKYFTL